MKKTDADRYEAVVEAPRGLSVEDHNGLTALRMFLKDYRVADIDVEPTGEGYRITANRKNGKPAFSSWGKNIISAIENMVRSVTGVDRR